jgi:hypothetical protein
MIRYGLLVFFGVKGRPQILPLGWSWLGLWSQGWVGLLAFFHALLFDCPIRQVSGECLLLMGSTEHEDSTV